MLKVLFFDQYDLEQVRGFTRRLERPVKQAAPLYRANAPWETGYIGLYGSVLRRPDGLYQLWHWTRLRKEIEGHLGGMAYADSDDGLKWRRRLFDLYHWRGRPMNICFPEKTHGPAIIYDVEETRDDWRYKMIAGTPPTGFISVYHSPNGTDWTLAAPEPVIARSPSGPMSLFRRTDALYILYVRTAADGRRLARSESTDFVHWSTPRTVIEPGPETPPYTEFFAMTAMQYGAFEIGLPWLYHTRPTDRTWDKQACVTEAELAYTRSGDAWHRVAPGTPFIPRGRGKAWDRGSVLLASSPVLEEKEIRFYYTATAVAYRADWKRHATDMGLSMAVSQPDRFVGLEAGTTDGVIESRAFALRSPEIYVNAAVARGGTATVEILDMEGRPLKSFRSRPLTGNGVALPVQWAGEVDASALVMKPLRFRLRARRATLYSVWMRDGDASPVYYRFRTIGRGDPMRAIGVDAHRH